MVHGFTGCVRNGLVAAAIAAAGTVTMPSVARADAGVLRVCAESDALPFSNAAGQGYENRIAALIAHAIGDRLSYVWTSGSSLAALTAGQCDAVMAIPQQADAVDTTAPYFESSYVFVSRADRGLDIDSMKDHRLKSLRIGVETIDGGRVATPPLRALDDRGLTKNAVAFPVSARGGQRGKMIAAVARGDVDVAVIWGPVGGYFAGRSAVPLSVTPITDTDEFSAHKHHVELIAFQYDISMGVRKGDAVLRGKLDQAIAHEHAAIGKILAEFGVPVVKPPQLADAADIR